MKNCSDAPESAVVSRDGHGARQAPPRQGRRLARVAELLDLVVNECPVAVDVEVLEHLGGVLFHVLLTRASRGGQ